MAKSSKISETLTSLAGVTTYQVGVTQASAFRLIKKITDEALKPFHLTTSQWFMIGILKDAGTDGITVTELSVRLGTNVPFVTNTAKLLAHRHMVVRSNHSENGRAKILRLHPDFAPQVAEIEDTVRESLRASIYSKVPRQDFLTYINVLYMFNTLS